MKQFLALCVSVLLVAAKYGNCETEMEEVPMAKVGASVMKDGAFEIEAVLKQKMPRGEDMMPADVMITQKNIGTEAVGPVTVYVADVTMEDCATYVVSDMDLNLSAFVQMMANASTADMPELEMPSNLPDVNLFELTDHKLVVVDAAGAKFCAAFEVKETEEMEKLELKFSNVVMFNRETMSRVIRMELDLPEGAVQIVKKEMMGDCAVAEVYFNADFGNEETLKKAFMAFGTKDQLSLFSPTEMCMSNVKESFIGAMIIKNYLKADMKDDEEKPVTCTGVTGRLAEEYRARLKKYDCMVAAYAKKYGGSLSGCTNMDQGDESEEGGDWSAPEWGNAWNGGEADMSYEILAKYIGVTDVTGLEEKKAELRELLDGKAPNMEKLTEVTTKIKELQATKDDLMKKSKFGLCLIARKGDDAFEKLKYVKKRFAEAEMWTEEGEKVLKEMIRENLSGKMKKIAKYSNMTKWEDLTDVMRMKLMRLLDINGECSSEEERNRIAVTLSKIHETVPEYLSALEEKIDIPAVKTFLNETMRMFTENTEAIVTKIYTILYFPIGIMAEDKELMEEKTKMFFSLIANHSDELSAKFDEWLDEAELDKLMMAQIMLLGDDEVKKGCSLKDLAEKVKSMMSTTDRETPCSKSGYAGRRGEAFGWRRNQGYEWEGGRDNGYQYQAQMNGDDYDERYYRSDRGQGRKYY